MSPSSARCGRAAQTQAQTQSQAWSLITQSQTRSQACCPSWACRAVLCLLVLACVALRVSCEEDYYSLLGTSRDASTREIRQAFKRLALTMHPDKNPNDQAAHDKFLKINRAYEVLKDEDLRKKYDKYGEKGLDQQQGGGRYESWSYYRYDFGIYDEDLEIITLDRADFDAAVNSRELWFVNFYYPRCSHCHELAPTWREFAREMDGVVRIGAVNCGDNVRLCRSKGISSYPSLYMFRAGMNPEKYYGDRSRESLTQFAMRFVTSRVTELWQELQQKILHRRLTSGPMLKRAVMRPDDPRQLGRLASGRRSNSAGCKDIHPSIVIRLSGVGSRRQQFQHQAPDIPFPSSVHQL